MGDLVIRHPGTPGRHRAGGAHTAVHRRLWDGPARAEAERLSQIWNGWSVLYSLGSRRFYAIAAWPMPESLMVESDTPEGLEERMREAETFFARRALPRPPQSRHGGTASQACSARR